MPALALCLAGAWAHAECTKDLDCAGEQICEQGKCVDAPASPPAPPVAATAPAEPAAAAPAVPPRVLGPPRVIVVESPPAAKSTRYGARSPGLIVVGSIVVTIGLVELLAALVVSSQATCYHQLSDDFKVEHCERSPQYAAFALGGGLLLAGAPMIVYGAVRVPKAEARLAPWLSPHSGGLSLKLTL